MLHSFYINKLARGRGGSLYGDKYCGRHQGAPDDNLLTPNTSSSLLGVREGRVQGGEMGVTDSLSGEEKERCRKECKSLEGNEHELEKIARKIKVVVVWVSER